VMPYLFAIVALVLVSMSRRGRGSEGPVHLGQPYVREELA
jgi:ABC-type uncharacterized transport system permease subunit